MRSLGVRVKQRGVAFSQFLWLVAVGFVSYVSYVGTLSSRLIKHLLIISFRRYFNRLIKITVRARANRGDFECGA